MRKICIVLLLALCFPLFSQQDIESAIYIPLVLGGGSEFEDSSSFTRLLEVETLTYNYRAVKNPKEAAYSLIGRIAPYGNGNFVFQLDLVDNISGNVIVQQEIIYHHFNEVPPLFPLLMHTMFSNIPERESEESAPVPVVTQRQGHWLVLGAYGFWAPRIYTDDSTLVYFLNCGVGLSAEVSFLSFLSLEAGAEITSDWIVIAGNTNDYFPDFVLEVPVFLKYVYNPSDSYYIGPYGGIKANVSIKGVTNPHALSWLGGVQYGTRVGSGYVFVDARYSADLGTSTVNFGYADYEYSRYMLQIGVGYKYGLFSKEGK